MQTTHIVPPGATVTNPVEFELIRKDGQPSPSEFAVPGRRAYNVGRRTRPTGPPRSRMHIPKTRGLSADELWEQRCSVLPKRQNWCLVWIFYIPSEPGTTFKSIKTVFVGTYKTKQIAESAQIRARGMYPNRASMLSRIGFWQALPVPRWLDKFPEVDAYNGTVIKRLINQDFKKTRIEHEVLRRRAKARADVESDPPEMASEKVENVVYGKAAIDDEDDKEPVSSRPSEQWESVSGKGLISRQQRIGLAWVLPSVQRRGRDLKEVAVAWLGTFRSVTEANNQQQLIKAKHPEWDVHSFTVGEPIDLPVPIWELQKRELVQYNQDMLGDFMRSIPGNGKSGNEILPPDMRESRTVEDDVQKQHEEDLVDLIIAETKTDEPIDDNTGLVQLGIETKDFGHGLSIKCETFGQPENPTDCKDVETETSELG